jgi:UDP-2,3-diacylglucosamine hydrolase
VASETVWVVQDAHLGAAPVSVAEALHQFVDRIPRPGDHLVINGDLFEFWFEYGSVVPREAFPTLAKLAALRDRGVRLTVTGGNHDRWTRGFWERELGAAFAPDRVELRLAGWRALVAHGDGLAETEIRARLLHAVTRHPLTAAAFRWVHPDLGRALVKRLSGVLAGRPPSRREREQAAAAQERWARALLASRPDLDLVILGHTHEPVLRQVADTRWYVNPGSWIEGLWYAEVTSDGPVLRTFVPG